MRRPRLVATSMKNLLSSLGARTAEQLSKDARKSMVMRNIVARITKGRPVTKPTLGRVARYAAAKVGISEEKTHNHLPLKGQLTTDQLYFNLREATRVALPSGARAIIETTGMPFRFSEGDSNIIRIKLTPVRQKKEDLAAFREFMPKRDIAEKLAGSLGYLGFNLRVLPNETSPSLVVWVVQERGLPGAPKRIQKLYSEWDMELVNFLEAEARRLGLKRFVVATDKNPYVNGIELSYARFHSGKGTREILQQYISLQRKLARRGYTEVSTKFKGSENDYHSGELSFMEKTLS